jgi:DNA-binding response OmpR family regulator
MSPSFKSIVVPLSEVPLGELAAEEVREPIVLVVDDEHLVADTLTIIFQRAGYCVLTAYDALEALEISSGIQPDILVSDVDMPKMNGVDLALTLLKRLPQCRVLLFSGHATVADLASAREAGHDFPLLPKPVHPAEMLRNVSKCLGRRATEPKVRMAEVITMPGIPQMA